MTTDMEITSFFVADREKAKLEGDHANYQRHLSSRINSSRRRLGIATKPRSKYTGDHVVTKEEIVKHHESVRYVGG